MTNYIVKGQEVIDYVFEVEATDEAEAKQKAEALKATDWIPYYTNSKFNIKSVKEIS